MDWLRKNPFYALLAAGGLPAALLAGYFLFDAAGRYEGAAAAFEESRSKLQRLQDSQPFPDATNVQRSREELDGARSVVGDIARGLAVEAPATTAQGFQDELRRMVSDITTRAAAAGVTLGENFYLGFETYETQPPSAAAATQLALQLRSIHAVAALLVEARVAEISSIARPPLAVEKAGGTPAAPDAPPDLVLAPFDVHFTADQSAFRAAFNKILETDPPVFVRLVAVTNSAPAGPSKEEAAAATDAAESIKPVLGKELTVVHLWLASIASATTAPN
jgi:hypothetical protein